MAEAHQAVAFQFTVTDNGIIVDFDRVAINKLIQAGLHALRLKWSNFRNALWKGVFPNSAKSYVIIIMLLVLLRYLQFGPAKYLLRLEAYIPLLSPMVTVCTYLVMLATILWVTLAYFKRYLLKLLLKYKGWLYDDIGHVSYKTKVWYVLVKFLLSGSKTKLLSCQSSLPRLPVPSLDATGKRYLSSIRPLTNDEQYSRMEKLVNEFCSSIGRKLQRYLILYSWWANNYVSDWWENYVYLHSRDALMINSNYYLIDGGTEEAVTTVQAARAASVTRTLLQYRQMIDEERMEPLMLRKMIPVCCKQYIRQLNTTRIPGSKSDKLIHYNSNFSRHIAVYRKGRYYKIDLYRGPRWLKIVELEKQFQAILDDDSIEPQYGELKLASMTAQDRTYWAMLRDKYFSRGVNKQSLEIIEKAAFVVILDDTEQFYDQNNPSKLNRFCKSALCGNGYNRWFDKSATIIIYANGRLGINAEHSLGDAPIFAHMMEIIMFNDMFQGRFKPDGHCFGETKRRLRPPTRLKWNMTHDCAMEIEKCAVIAKKAIDDLDLFVLDFNDYGKGFMKKCKVSPDGYIQMAMQLTYYKLAGRQCLTYESCMTRLFAEGRTETVRPATMSSAKFVHTVLDTSKSDDEKRQSFRGACNDHANYVKDAMVGEGVDRHLFCLYVVSQYLKVDSPFLKEVLTEPWRLSTSQTPVQTDLFVDDITSKKACVGGGFGPVTRDGYGVSYIFTGNNCLMIHITCKKSCKTTSSLKFATTLRESMLEIKQLFENA